MAKPTILTVDDDLDVLQAIAFGLFGLILGIGNWGFGTA